MMAFFENPDKHNCLEFIKTVCHELNDLGYKAELPERLHSGVLTSSYRERLMEAGVRLTISEDAADYSLCKLYNSSGEAVSDNYFSITGLSMTGVQTYQVNTEIDGFLVFSYTPRSIMSIEEVGNFHIGLANEDTFMFEDNNSDHKILIPINDWDSDDYKVVKATVNMLTSLKNDYFKKTVIKKFRNWKK